MCVCRWAGRTWSRRRPARDGLHAARMQQPGPRPAGACSTCRGRRTAGPPARRRARASYEPRSLATHTTQTNIQQLFALLPADRRPRSTCARVPGGDRLAGELPARRRTRREGTRCSRRPHAPDLHRAGHQRRDLVHRFGSNIHNGAYYFDKNITHTLSHYSAGRVVNIPALEARYDQLAAMSDAEVEDMVERSPLSAHRPRKLPKYFTAVGREVDFPDLFEGAVMTTPVVPETEVNTLVERARYQGYWTAPVPEILNPFIGDGPTTPHPAPNTKASTWATSTTPRRIRPTIRRPSRPTCRSPSRSSSSRRN